MRRRQSKPPPSHTDPPPPQAATPTPERAPQPPTRHLYALIAKRRWDEAAVRCVDHPEDARWTDGNGCLPIHLACLTGAPLSLVRRLREAHGDGVETRDNFGWKPVHHACECGQCSVEVVRYLQDCTNNVDREGQ